MYYWISIEKQSEMSPCHIAWHVTQSLSAWGYKTGSHKVIPISLINSKPQCFAKAGKMEPNHLFNGFGPLQPAVAMLWWQHELFLSCLFFFCFRRKPRWHSSISKKKFILINVNTMYCDCLFYKLNIFQHFLFFFKK